MFNKVFSLFFVTITAILPVIINPFATDYYYKPKVNIIYIACTILVVCYFISCEKKEIHKIKLDSKVHKLVLIYGILIILSALFSVNLNKAIYGEIYRYEGCLTLLCYLIIFIFVSSYYKYNEKHLIAFSISAIIISTYAIFQFYGIDPIPRDIFRVNWVKHSNNYRHIFCNICFCCF